MTLGLDLSITAPGIIIFQSDSSAVFGKVCHERCPMTKPADDKHWGLVKGMFYGSDEERIDYIKRKVSYAWRNFQPEVVAIEQYAFGARGRGLSILHELGGVVKNWLYQHEALVFMPTATELKLFATGRGNATKEDMMNAALDFGYDCEGNDNLSDAYHLARYAAWVEITAA